MGGGSFGGRKGLTTKGTKVTKRETNEKENTLNDRLRVSFLLRFFLSGFCTLCDLSDLCG
jgi:hypothetical protein